MNRDLWKSVIPLEFTSRYLYWPYNHRRKKIRSKIIQRRDTEFVQENDLMTGVIGRQSFPGE